MPVNQSDLLFFKKAQQIMKRAILRTNGTPSIAEMRAITKEFQPFLPSQPLLPYKNIFIPSPEGHKIKVRLIDQGDNTTPFILFFPGTAFIYPLFDENYTILSRIANYTGYKAMMVEYRLSPEHPYPSPYHDALTVLTALFEQAKTLKINSAKIILSGYSSGANLAAVLSNTLQGNKDINILHQYLFSGGFDYTDSLHEYDSFADEDKMLDKASAKLSFDLYCQKANRKDPLCSPYWQNDFSALCPTTIQCGEFDGGRSQSEGYAKKLIAHGVHVNKIVIPGQTHFTLLYRGACYDGDDPAQIAAARLC